LTSIGAQTVVWFAVFTATAVMLWLNGSLALRLSQRRPTQAVAAFAWTRQAIRRRQTCSRSCAIDCRGPDYSAGAGLLALLVAWPKPATGASCCGFYIKFPMASAIRFTTRHRLLSLLVARLYPHQGLDAAYPLSERAFRRNDLLVRGDIEYDVHHRSMSPTAIAHGSALLGLLSR